MVSGRWPVRMTRGWASRQASRNGVDEVDAFLLEPVEVGRLYVRISRVAEGFNRHWSASTKRMFGLMGLAEAGD